MSIQVSFLHCGDFLIYNGKGIGAINSYLVFYFLKLNLYVCVYEHMYLRAGVCGDQRRPSNSLERELDLIVSHPMSVLEPELWSLCKSSKHLNR